MRSPCFDCNLKGADKNGTECLKCEKRWEYVGRLAGEDAGAGSGGPDIQTKRRAQMSMRGTCRNCERENMTLPAQRLCGLCNGAYVRAPESGKEAALAAAKAKVQGLMPVRRLAGPRTRKKKPAKSDTRISAPEGLSANIFTKEKLDKIDFVGEKKAEAISDPPAYYGAALPISELNALACKTMGLKRLFDAIFEANDERHLKIAIMAAISDAYQKGVSNSQRLFAVAQRP